MYTKTREQLLSEIEGKRFMFGFPCHSITDVFPLLGEAPVVPSSYGFGTPKSEHNQEPIVYWEYRWEPSGEIYGPFAAKEMQAWMDQVCHEPLDLSLVPNRFIRVTSIRASLHASGRAMITQSSFPR